MVGDGISSIRVIIFLFDESVDIWIDRSATIAELRVAWHQQIRTTPSVAFFTTGDRYLPDDWTLAQALHETGGRRILEAQAVLKSTFYLRLFGFDDSETVFEAAPQLTLAAVREEMARALGIFNSDFRLYIDDEEVDMNVLFEDIEEGSRILLDPKMTVRINMPRADSEDEGGDENEDNEATTVIECYASASVGDLRRRLEISDAIALVADQPIRLLDESTSIARLVSSEVELALPIKLAAERKQLVFFQPSTLEHMRQQVPVPMSATPLDLMGELFARFEMATQFRLLAYGEPLNSFIPLAQQGITSDTVIELDPVRPCNIRELWLDYSEDRYNEDTVFLYSTQNASDLLRRDIFDAQKLFFDYIELTIFGALQDVIGPTSGKKRTVLVFDRDVNRSIPFLQWDDVIRRGCWANEILSDVTEMNAERVPHEIALYNNLVNHGCALRDIRADEQSLITVDPLKLFLHDNKKLRICRVPRCSTHADLRARLQQWKGQHVQSLTASNRASTEADKDRRIDLEMLSLINISKYETKVQVEVKNKKYHCWFEEQSVKFSDVIINIGRQAKVTPRQLFRCQLFCRGCGRQVSYDEEEFQVIPASCCRVRSLQLSDRRVKDAGSQTKVRRSRLGGIEPLDSPQMQVATMNVGSSYKSVTIDATTARDRAVVNVAGRSSNKRVDASAARKRAVVNVAGRSSNKRVNASTARKKKTVVCTRSSYKTKTVCATDPLHVDYPLRICLPDGLQVEHTVRPLDTTADLVSAMQRLRPDLRIGDITWEAVCLTAAANWQRLRLIQDWRIDAGCQLQLHARPAAMRMVAWSPHGDNESKIVHLEAEESAGQVLETAREQFEKVKIGESAAFLGQEILHKIDRRQRRSVSCFDPAKGKYLYIDTESGLPSEVRSCKFIVRRYLSATSALPAAPRHAPAFVIHTEVQLLTVAADRQLKVARPAAMTDPAFVAFMEGVMIKDQPAKFFWKIRGGDSILDALSGEIFANRKAIPDEGPRSNILCLLRSGDRPPLCRVPKGEYFQLFCRTGVRVEMKADLLRAVESQQPSDVERWLLPYKLDQLAEDFAASARLK